jgi:hypothetical protein
MDILCGICDKHIECCRPNQLYHQGECSREAHRRLCRVRARTKPPRKEKSEKTCQYCGNKYLTSWHTSVSCREPRCINAYRRERAKRIWDAMSSEERILFRKKKYVNSPMALKQYKHCEAPVLECICPGCGVKHMRRFEYGYCGKGTPRFNCPSYPGCISDNIGIVMMEVYTGGNECWI